MERKVIVQGDSTDHGGVVISGSPTRRINGRAIARMGDSVSCPKHGENQIIEGDPNFRIDGVPVALHGHKSACGCTLIGSVSATRS